MEHEEQIKVQEGEWNTLTVAQDVLKMGQEEPFYVADLGVLLHQLQHWKQLMPRVEPFYAVKCNSYGPLLSTLAALGVGFDCASLKEIQTILDLGVCPERIIFAHPTKIVSHVKYSKSCGVQTMTFDSEEELYKIKTHQPDAKLVIRIRCDASLAQVKFGEKFGCDATFEAATLLRLAAKLQLNVIGVSFHVGSGCLEVGAFERAIRHARTIFDKVEYMCHRQMYLLDIGGGFPGHSNAVFKQFADVVNAALSKYFPDDSVRVIAEPGRYFAEPTFTLFTQIHSKREIRFAAGANGRKDNSTMYFINDGVYGSFINSLILDEKVTPEPLKKTKGQPTWCSIWGPSMDSLDCVLKSSLLPPLQPGDWLFFRNMGAYTMIFASSYNGFPVPRVKPVIDKAEWDKIKDKFPYCFSL